MFWSRVAGAEFSRAYAKSRSRLLIVVTHIGDHLERAKFLESVGEIITYFQANVLLAAMDVGNCEIITDDL